MDKATKRKYCQAQDNLWVTDLQVLSELDLYLSVFFVLAVAFICLLFLSIFLSFLFIGPQRPEQR